MRAHAAGCDQKHDRHRRHADQAAWQVPDVRAEVKELRSRGVKVEEYDMPGLKTKDGIADIGFAWMAWIIDPGKNALAIFQVKE